MAASLPYTSGASRTTGASSTSSPSPVPTAEPCSWEYAASACVFGICSVHSDVMKSATKEPLLFEQGALPRALPVVGEQKDIRYYGTIARSVLNGPENTGMGYWSINPYIGCAFRRA